MPNQIDDIFARSPVTSDARTERAAIDRVKSAILHDVHALRPIAGNWAFSLTLFSVWLLFAIGSAALLGMHGLAVLSPFERGAILGAIVLMAALSSAAAARTMRPASGFDGAPYFLAVASVGFPALFGILFHGYDLGWFVPQGVPCLRAGLMVAVPTGLVISLVLRRGFVLSWTSAGVVSGVLSGIAGLGMLELHCPNLKAIHVMVWHVAVVTTSGILGYLAGNIADKVRRSRAFSSHK